MASALETCATAKGRPAVRGTHLHLAYCETRRVVELCLRSRPIRRGVRPALGGIWLVAVVAGCSACTYGTPRSFGPNQLSRPTSSNALAAPRRGSVSARERQPNSLSGGSPLVHTHQDQVPEVAPEAWPASQRAGVLAGVSSAVALPARLLYLPLRRCAELVTPIACEHHGANQLSYARSERSTARATCSRERARTAHPRATRQRSGLPAEHSSPRSARTTA